MAGKVNPIPEEYRGATPYLCVKEAARAIEFYKNAFGAREVMRMAQPDGRIGHAELRIGAAPIMLAVMAGMMLVPPPALHTRYGVPREVLREARRSPLARRNLRDSVAKLRRLAVELGLVTGWTRPMWKRFGLWDD